MNSKAQIIATVGPSSATIPVLSQMIEHNMDVARLNLAWGDLGVHKQYIDEIREAEKMSGRKILILLDLPGPRIQNTDGHTYNTDVHFALTNEDRDYIRFGVENKVDYFSESFVGDEKDVAMCREAIHSCGGHQPVVAKIERKKALTNLEKIIEVADALMVARGDLGVEVPLEQIPFVQANIIQRAKKAGKPVITATQMMLSMIEHDVPTRAEVTDVANAILQGTDAVMLSEETAIGKYPVQSVTMMEKIVVEAEKHMKGILHINPL